MYAKVHFSFVVFGGPAQRERIFFVAWLTAVERPATNMCETMGEVVSLGVNETELGFFALHRAVNEKLINLNLVNLRSTQKYDTQI